MKIKWLGWASWLIKTNGKTIYIDPFLGEVEEKADIVLVSHNHPDHCDLEQLERMRKDETLILTPSEFAKDINAESLDIGQTKDIEDIKVTAVPAYNLNIPNHQKNRDAGFIVEIEGKRIYFAADTDLIDEMDNLENIDIALLPVGGTYTMDQTQATEAVKKIKPKTVIPMHYGSIDVEFGGEKKHIEFKFDKEKFKQDVGDTAEVIILGQGQEIEI